LEQNPLLERDEASAEGTPEEPAPPEPVSAEGEEAGPDEETLIQATGEDGDGSLDLGGDPIAWQNSTQPRTSATDDLPGIEQTLSRPLSLREHLLTQLALDITDPIDRIIGAQLIEMVDEAGYLTGDLAMVAEQLGCPLERVTAVLKRLQRFDPPGICAQNLAECLALQLADRDRLDPAMQKLIEHLPLLANRDAASLMRICGVDAEDLSQMVTEIKALSPKPGLAFDNVTITPVVPDVLLRALPDGSWAVELNSETLPRILVNNRYYAEVNTSARNKVEKEYLAERHQQANWLVKALHQRATTILKVAREIVRQQEGFFRHGVQHLKPLVLRDIAAEIGMHESTVSRVTSNKYMATPRGIYELKYFFTASVASASGGDALSAESVRHRIKTLIDNENGNVLSDDRIAELLLAEGADIARRTVAKYREAMRIPSSVQRRRNKSLSF